MEVSSLIQAGRTAKQRERGELKAKTLALAILVLVIVSLVPMFTVAAGSYTENQCIELAVAYMHKKHPETKGYTPVDVSSTYRPCSRYDIVLTYDNGVAFKWTGTVNRWSGCVCESSYEYTVKPRIKISSGVVINIIPFDGFPVTIGCGLPDADTKYTLTLTIYNGTAALLTKTISIEPHYNWVAVNVGKNTISAATHVVWIAPTWTLTQSIF